MRDFFTEKQKHTQADAFERDVPFDIAREYGEARFAQFYLEQTNQQSNVYFEQSQREHIPQEPLQMHRTGAFPSVSRFSFLWSFARAGAMGVLLVAVIGVTWWWSEGAQRSPVFTDARGAYEDTLTAQEAFAQFDLEQAVFAFHAVHERAAQRSQGIHALIASAEGALTSLFRAEGSEGYADIATLEHEALGAAEKLAQGMEPLFQVSLNSFFHMKDAYAGVPAGESMGDALLGIREAITAFHTIQKIFVAVKDEVVLPKDTQAQISILAPQLSLASAHAQELASYLKLGVWALGVERPRKFLLVVQDSAVARATGGVISSVGVVTTRGGAITDISFDDVYSIDGQLQANVVPPEPIQKVATAWALHDANWFLDFPLSAKKIAYFYEKSGGGEVDGVIALNDHVVRRILALTGPVKGAGGILVNAESHEGLAHTDTVRAVAGVLPTFTGESTRALVRMIQEGVHEKDIIVWLAERDYQDMIVQKEWSGSVIGDAGADYLAVVSSDVGDRATEKEVAIWKETNITQSGEIVNTVAVQFLPRTDGGRSESGRYVRVYVPVGSELLETSGFAPMTIRPQIDYIKERFIVDEDLARTERIINEDDPGARVFEESGKTVFGGWVAQGEKNDTIIVRYRLPFSLRDTSSSAPIEFIFQKQPGVSAKINFSLIVPEGARATDIEGNDLTVFSADGTSDITLQAIIK